MTVTGHTHDSEDDDAMQLKPVQKQRIYQHVIMQIKQSIERGELNPGDKLPSERELAERLAVSRTAVREAISVLEALRLVEVLPGVGIFLRARPSADLAAHMEEIVRTGHSDLLHLLETRQAIECQAARYAALRRSAADLQSLEEAYDRLRASVDRGEVAAEEDFHFHLAVVEAAHNPIMLETVKIFSERFLTGLHYSRSESINIPGKSREVLAEHRLIYEAIAAGDPELAYGRMWTHLENVKSRYY